MPEQAVVAGDIGFTFGAVEDQGVDRAVAGVGFHCRRERRTAQTHDAGFEDDPAQLVRGESLVIGMRLGFECQILAIGIDHDGQVGEAGRVRERARLDGADDA